MSAGGQTEEAPSWEQLCLAARVLQLDSFDARQTGPARRLSYDEFEELFYRLLFMIHPKEAKRHLKKARSPEERARFIEAVTSLMNDKKLTSKKLTTSQLKTYGGETFRRVLGALMKSACDKQSSLLRAKRLTKRPDGQAQGAMEVQELTEQIEANRKEIKELLNRLAKLHARRDELKREAAKANPSQLIRDPSREMDVCNQLLSRLERAASETNSALSKLRGVELPAMNRVRLQETEGQGSEKRLSQFIREVKARNNPNQASEDKSLGERIGKQISDYDEQMTVLLERLRREADNADEMMLKNPEIRERFERLEKLLPKARSASILAPLQTFEAPDMELLAKVLAEFPDPHCDDKQALEVFKMVLDKRLKKETSSTTSSS